MSLFEEFCFIVATVNLGEFYPPIFATLITLLVWSFNLLLLAFKPMRKFSKPLALTITLFLISLVILKAFCDLIVGKRVNEFSIGFSLCLLPLAFLGLAISFAFKPTKNTLSNSEKQLIDRFLCSGSPEDSLLSPNVFSSNPFKRIENLATQKGFEYNAFSDFNLNPSYVESCVNELLKKDLNAKDRLAVTQISNAVKKYKLKNLSDFERDDFSTNLQMLIKLTAKYDNANSDLF